LLGVLALSGRGALADDTAAVKKTCADAYVAAQGLRDDHKLIAARAQLRVCAHSECSPLMQGQLIKDCTEWLTAVEAAIPTVVLAAKDASGNELQDVAVSVDGTAVAQQLDGKAIELEAGTHSFTFTSAKGPAVTETVVVLEGNKNQTVSATFPGPPAPPPAAPPPTPPPVVAPAPPPAYWTGQRILGVAIAGGGLVGMGVGGILALSAKSQFNTAENESGQPRVSDSQSAANLGNVASVVVGVGGAVLVGGLVVWLLAPSQQTQVGMSGSQVVFRGTF
jgi:hypothetical protein